MVRATKPTLRPHRSPILRSCHVRGWTPVRHAAISRAARPSMHAARRLQTSSGHAASVRPAALVPSLAGPSQSAARRMCSNGRGRRAAGCACRAVWDESMTLSDLRAQLDAALAVEDYKQAARLRDAIAQKDVDGRLGVEDANTLFYEAFMSGSVAKMDLVWGEGDHVQVIHPGCSCIAGRDNVMESWKSILAGVRPRAFRIELQDVRVFAADGLGFVTCVEVVDADDSAGRICATNVFERQNGKWKLVMHQGGPAPVVVRRARR